MREIKFRAWDKSNKMMLQSSGLGFDKEKQELSIDSVDTLWKWENDDFQEVADNFVIMQYTGLKDKNGKEIYEGDLIKNYYWKTPRIEIVKYNNTGYWEPFIDWESGINHPWQDEDVEIIGNIYENPELLKVK